MSNPVQIDGVKDVRKRLRRAGDDLSDMRELHREIAKDIVAAARPKTPVLNDVLRKTVRGSGTKTQVVVRMGSKKAPYAAAIHWGRNRWPRGGVSETPSGRRPHTSVIARRAFIYDTAKSMDAQIQAKYARYIDKVINES